MATAVTTTRALGRFLSQPSGGFPHRPAVLLESNQLRRAAAALETLLRIALALEVDLSILLKRARQAIDG